MKEGRDIRGKPETKFSISMIWKIFVIGDFFMAITLDRNFEPCPLTLFFGCELDEVMVLEKKYL